jgi:hypothetical protein
MLRRLPELKKMLPRRFPPTWTVEEPSACFVLRDHNGQALAYVYFEERPGKLTPVIIPKEMALAKKYGSRQLPQVQCGLGLGIGTTARAGVVSVTGELSLWEGSGCQLGFIAQYPPPLTMADWHSSMLS